MENNNAKVTNHSAEIKARLANAEIKARLANIANHSAEISQVRAKLAKMKKIEVLDYLNNMISKNKTLVDKNQNLTDRAKYVLDVKHKAQVSDLRELAEDVVTYLFSVQPVQQAPANSVKRKLSKVEKPEEKVPANTEKTEKLKVEKKSVERRAEKEAENKVTEIGGRISADFDNIPVFPEELKVPDGDETIVLKKAGLNDYASVVKSIEGNNEIYIAIHWTKRQIVQYDYSVFGRYTIPNGKFNNDMDIAQIIYPGEKVALAISAITEAPYTIFPECFTLDKEVGMRFTGGMEFEIYCKK